MHGYLNNVRGYYRRTPEGWTLQPAPSKSSLYKNQHLLPPVFNFRAGGLEPVAFDLWPQRVRLGAGPLPSLAAGHLVHLSQGSPVVGTLYAYVPGEEEAHLELTPTPGDRANPHHMLRRFASLLDIDNPQAAASISRGSFSYSFLPMSDELPALYARFAL